MGRTRAVIQQEELLVKRLGFGKKQDSNEAEKINFAWDLLTTWPGSGNNLATIEVILHRAMDEQDIYCESANRWIHANIATSRANIFFALLHLTTLSPDRPGRIAKVADTFRPLRNLEQRLFLEALQGHPSSWEQIRQKSPIPLSLPTHRSDVIAACKLLMPKPSDQEAIVIALQSLQEPELEQMPKLQAAIVQIFIQTGNTALLQEISDRFSLFAKVMVEFICYGNASYHTERDGRLYILAQMLKNQIGSLPSELISSLVRWLTSSRTYNGLSVYGQLIEIGEEVSLDYLADMLSKICNERNVISEALKNAGGTEDTKVKDLRLRFYEQDASACMVKVTDKLTTVEIVNLIGRLHEVYVGFPENPLLTALCSKMLARAEDNDLLLDMLMPLAANDKLPAEILVNVMKQNNYPWQSTLFQQWLQRSISLAEGKKLDSFLRSYIQALASIRRSAGPSSTLTVGNLIRTHTVFLFENGHHPMAIDFQLQKDEKLAGILPKKDHQFLHAPLIWGDPAWRAVLLQVAGTDESGSMLRWLLDSSEPVLNLNEKRQNNTKDVEEAVFWLNSILPAWQNQPSTMRLAWIQMVTTSHSPYHRLTLPYLASAWGQMDAEEKESLSAYAKKNWLFITTHAIPANFVGFMSTVLTNEEQLDAFFAQPIHKDSTSNKIGRFSELSHLFQTRQAQKRLLRWLSKHTDEIEPHALTAWMLRLNFQRFSSARIILRRIRIDRLYSKKTIEELDKALEPYGSS